MAYKTNKFLLNLITDRYKNYTYIIPPSNKKVFVCGASGDDSIRNKLLHHLKINYKKHDYILAEEVNAIVPENSDLLTQENILLKYSDCVIIILESFSACAELGAFVNYKDSKDNNNFIDKIFVYNDFQFHDAISFINKGPLKMLDSSSCNKVYYYHNNDPCEIDISELMKGLEKFFPKYKKKNSILGIEDLKKSTESTNFINTLYPLIIDIVKLVSPIRNNDLIFLLNKILNNHEKTYYEPKEILGILISLKYLKEIKINKKYSLIIIGSKKEDFISVNKKYALDRQRVLRYYKKNEQNILKSYYRYYNEKK